MVVYPLMAGVAGMMGGQPAVMNTVLNLNFWLALVVTGMLGIGGGPILGPLLLGTLFACGLQLTSFDQSLVYNPKSLQPPCPLPWSVLFSHAIYYDVLRSF